ncbi:MAG TPA: hypothetical protein VE621_02610 [Bryobacteraceae bacterium]|nr:hypothetical protein [Bryobacteraceae bacterium]
MIQSNSVGTAVEALEIPGAYVYHIPVATNKLAGQDLLRLKKILARFIELACRNWKLTPEYLVRVDKRLGESWNDLLAKHGSYWSISTGMILRPGWRPQAMPTIEELLAKAQKGWQIEPPQMVETVDRIVRDRHFERFFPGMQWPSPFDVYLGCGGCFAFLTSSTEHLFRQTKLTFGAELPASLNMFSFYTPFFEMSHWKSATASDLQSWFSLFDIYLAETEEEPGVLIASKHDLDALTTELEPLLTGRERV